ncbi:MAG: O-acetylhomoserine aminocarboxypropyltransferase/cysteine synthase family protein [Gemmatimonas sp.]
MADERPKPDKRRLDPNWGFETRALHAGTPPDAASGAVVPPIQQTAAYAFADADVAARRFDLDDFGNVYSRITNPTVAALEKKLAALEGGVGATCAASGHAAQILALLPLMSAGDDIVAARQLYGGSTAQFGTVFKRFGWGARTVDARDPGNIARAIGPKTRAVFVESLANPDGLVVDIQAIATATKRAGIPLIVDNTLASPYLLRPFEWGADLVIHSTTKFLNGHGNALGGAVIDGGSFDWSRVPTLAEPSGAYHGVRFAEKFGKLAFTVYAHAIGLRDLGPAMAPLNAFLTIVGVETLALRMQRHCENALAVARHLDRHPKVAWVSYAGLADSPQKALVAKYLPKGAGAVFTFGVKGGLDAGRKLVESVRLIQHVANLGDARTLMIHPASTTHRPLSEDQLREAGIGPEAVRISVGLETAADIIADLDQALSGI